jgi:hypothetical protein
MLNRVSHRRQCAITFRSNSSRHIVGSPLAKMPTIPRPVTATTASKPPSASTDRSMLTSRASRSVTSQGTAIVLTEFSAQLAETTFTSG